ncbi:MAG: hypothetical protein CL912_33145 [Deltaproteobacteria bacterium]|nr:hypothetical protein [Deltaproteobacteria bacterium]
MYGRHGRAANDPNSPAQRYAMLRTPAVAKMQRCRPDWALEYVQKQTPLNSMRHTLNDSDIFSSILVNPPFLSYACIQKRFIRLELKPRWSYPRSHVLIPIASHCPTTVLLRIIP